MSGRAIPGGHLKHISKLNTTEFHKGQAIIIQQKKEAEQFKLDHPLQTPDYYKR